MGSSYLSGPETLRGVLSPVGTLDCILAPIETLKGTLDVPITLVPDIYDGPTEFTPSEEIQTIGMADKYSTSSITINPIPSNYGLITYNGQTITIS